MRTVLLTWVLCALSATGCDSPRESDRPVRSLILDTTCDIQRGCDAGDAALSVHIQFDAPPRALQPFPVSVRTAGGQPVETVMLTFFMRGMDMGLNRYRMRDDAGSGWRAEVTLPICVSGRSDWIAEFEFLTAGQRILLRAPFVLEK